MAETKRERFKRIASVRVNRVCYRLKVLGNCANRSHYDFGDRDIDKMFDYIETELAVCRARFKRHAKPFRIEKEADGG